MHLGHKLNQWTPRPIPRHNRPPQLPTPQRHLPIIQPKRTLLLPRPVTRITLRRKNRAHILLEIYHPIHPPPNLPPPPAPRQRKPTPPPPPSPPHSTHS